MSGKRSTRGTFVMVKHANQKRTDLSKLTKRTLGTGNLREAVQLPRDAQLLEWLATNCVDFYNTVSVLYELCSDDAARFTKVGEGFPPHYEYRWADGAKQTKPIRCSSPVYVDYVLNWVEEQIHDERIFPIGEDSFPSNFQEIAHKIFTRIFRVYAIIYHSHFHMIEEHKAASHLNTSFKHFIFFAHEHSMLDKVEYDALKEPVERLLDQYENS